jgi:hypothetical protein
MSEGQVEAHRVERTGDATPDLIPRKAEVLASERHVVAHPSQHHLRIRVLEHESDPAPRILRPQSADEELTRAFAVVVSAEHAGDGMHEGRLAGTGCSEQKNAFAPLDAQVEAGHRPVGTAGVPPAPPPCVDDGRRLPVNGHGVASVRQTAAESVRPEAKRLSAPVFASPRTMNHDPRPAMTVPEMIAPTV